MTELQLHGLAIITAALGIGLFLIVPIYISIWIEKKYNIFGIPVLLVVMATMFIILGLGLYLFG